MLINQLPSLALIIASSVLTACGNCNLCQPQTEHWAKPLTISAESLIVAGNTPSHSLIDRLPEHALLPEGLRPESYTGTAGYA